MRRALIALLALASYSFAAPPDILIADFEGPDYAGWTATGNAFGSAPARGTLANQNKVSGFNGRGLVNTFLNGDKPTGTLTSPPFVIQRSHINFLIGGGGLPGTRITLLIDNKPVLSARGANDERLDWSSFNVDKHKGKTAVLRIEDHETGGWGHINVDHIHQSNQPKASLPLEPERTAEQGVAALKSHGVSEIVFAVRKVDPDNHWYANFSHWVDNPDRTLYHPGGRLCRLNLTTGQLTNLIDDPTGGVRDPQLHYDGRKILFSWRKGGQSFYHLYEINIDGSNLRQVTDGPYDDIEPAYLPDGDIVFCSSRCNRYVNCYFVRVAVLHRCRPDGSGIQPLSANIEQDNTPWILPDGRILYMRWEYIDRSQVAYHHLWTANPDGTGQMIYYGNQRPGVVMLDAKPIPNSRKVVASFSPGHGQNEHSGFVTVVDPDAGPDDPAAARPIRPNSMFRDPYPLSEDCFLLAGRSMRAGVTNDGGGDIFVLDGQGRLARIYSLPEQDVASGFKVHEPRPILVRPRERIIATKTDLKQSAGRVFVADVHHGRNMDGVKPGEIRKLLVLEALPKPVNFSGGWEPLTYGGSFTLERILGTVPVEVDGSAYIEIPPLRSLFFVALDEKNLSVKRMQSFVTVQPGETLGCIGCHEQRNQTLLSSRDRLAFRKPVRRIEPIPGVPEVIDFPRDIQPILDRHCLSCHDYTPHSAASAGPRAGGVILSGDRGPFYSHAYVNLTIHGQISDGRNLNKSNYAPRAIGSSASALLTKIEHHHHGVNLSEQEKTLVRLWIDTAAAYPGTYAALGSGMVRGIGWNKQTGQVLQRRCDSCHTGNRTLPRSPGDDLELGTTGTIRIGDPRLRYSNQSIFNLSRPEKSLLLLAPLSREAGGFGLCGSTVFSSPADPDYQTLLTAARESQAALERMKRFDMPGFRPNDPYIREMKAYGILPRDLDPAAPIDVYRTDQAYWQSLWHRP